MSDIGGRIPLTTVEPVADSQPVSKVENPARISTEEIEVPYQEYSKENGKPYLVDHYKLPKDWMDPDGGFYKEVEVINDYISDKIEKGEVANSVAAVKRLLKGMEKFNNLTQEERSVVKLEVLSHYVEFLQKNDRTRQNLRRYHG